MEPGKGPAQVRTAAHQGAPAAVLTPAVRSIHTGTHAVGNWKRPDPLKPQPLFLEPDGQVIHKAPGFQTVQSFLEFDRYIHGGHYKKQTLSKFLEK